MDSNRERPEFFKVFDFISKYKILLIVTPIIAMIAALSYSSFLPVKYTYTARFLLGHYWLQPQKEDKMFFLDPINVNNDINRGIYNLDVSQASGISTRELNYYSRIINEDEGILDIAYTAPPENKGTEVISSLISFIRAAEDREISKYRRNADTIREALELCAGTKKYISNIKNELSAVLDTHGDSSNINATDPSDLKMLWRIYSSIVDFNAYFNSIEAYLDGLHKNYSAVSEFRKLTIVYEPAKIDDQKNPDFLLIGLIALFMGLTGAVLSALIVDSIRKYRIEKTISS